MKSKLVVALVAGVCGYLMSHLAFFRFAYAVLQSLAIMRHKVRSLPPPPPLPLIDQPFVSTDNA